MAKKKKPTSPGDLCSNRKAFHDYEILDTFEAGISLQGTEVKSLRNHGGSLAEAYVKVIKEELYLIGAHIAPYSHGNIQNHPERRDRKLLMHRYEIDKLASQVHEKGLTLIPLSLYLKAGRAKIKIGIGKGKAKQDKRAALKERESKREIARAMKNL
jgi:SsrA-binding protein